MAVVADLTFRGLSQLDQPTVLGLDERAGPAFNVSGVLSGYRLQPIAAALDEK